jgi:hypothetical protein
MTLDDLHQRHGVEEVEAADALRPLAGGGDRRHRERRGIGGEDAVGGDDVLQLLEQRLLDVEVLDDGLDDDLGRREFIEPGDDFELRRRRCGSASAEILPLSASWPRVPVTVSRALAAAPCRASNSSTRMPAWAAIWAMPRPMAPVPTMPMQSEADWISTGIGASPGGMGRAPPA